MPENHLDPDLRRRVFETVTLDEALAVMRSKAGHPWNKAAAEIIIEGMRPIDHRLPGNQEDALSYVQRTNRL